MSNKNIVVTLTRTYWYNLDILDGKTVKDKTNDAIDKAYLDVSEEMIYFSSTPNDFFGHKTRIEPNNYDGKGTKKHIIESK